jgi:hypothetical protein
MRPAPQLLIQDLEYPTTETGSPMPVQNVHVGQVSERNIVCNDPDKPDLLERGIRMVCVIPLARNGADVS